MLFSQNCLQNHTSDATNYAEYIFLSQNWLRNHILQPQLPIQKSYVVCIYVQYTDILFTYKVPEANTHVPHHTQRGTDSTDGGKPPLVVSFSLCVWCECWRHVCVCASLGLTHTDTWIICLCIAYMHTINKSLHGQLWLKNMALPESILAEKYDFGLYFIKNTFFRKGVFEPRFE